MVGLFTPQAEDGDAAEAYHLADNFVATFFGDPEDGRYEHDLHELGLLVAEAMCDENEGPEYRRWEREDVIHHRCRWARR